MKFDLLRLRRSSVALIFLTIVVHSSELFAQGSTSTVKGIVQNSNNETLAGVSVIIRNTASHFTTGTSTDSLGVFTFPRISSGGPYTFTFSTVGYEPQTLSGYNIKENAILSLGIRLIPAAASLDQVVVVGYGTQKRKDLTGAVGSVGSKDIKEMSVTNVQQALLGKVAGVQVKPGTGAPGAAPQIRIRGIGSISAGGDPLYVVDGFPIENIELLNPNDIESMDILKDASATAIYGSRGSNGVIIINTKRGRTGRAVLSFDTYYGLQKVAKVPEVMNAREQAQYYYDGVRNRNLDAGNNVSGPPDTWVQKVPVTVLDVLAGKNTTDVDYLDHVLRTAPVQQYQLSASGGSENVKYSLSGEYLNQKGIIINSDFQRYSLRANIDAQLTKKLAVKLSLNPSYIDENIVSAAGMTNGPNVESVIGGALAVTPFYPVYDANGNYYLYQSLDAVGNFWHPVALAKEILNTQKKSRFLANVNAQYSITDNLKFNVLFGGTMLNSRGLRFRPQIPAFFNEPALGTNNSLMVINWLTEYTLNYNKVFGNHSFSGLGGYTVQKEHIEFNSLSSNKYPNNFVPTLSAVSGLISTGTSEINQWSLVSYLARVNYNYDSRYYLTASIRTDGSSRFGSNNKYGLFPSVALAWRISEEKFLKDLDFLSEMKVRASYGETGNNNIGNYDYLATVSYVNYNLGGVPIGGYAPSRLANPGLTWETQKSINVGIDASFFKKRISVTVDRFHSNNYNLLLSVNTPDITGFSTSLQNIGEVKNTGWEFILNTIVLDKKFRWETDFNFSTYRNEVVKLGPNGDPIISASHKTMIGQPIGMFYGWLTDGVYMNQSEVDNGPVYNPRASDRSRPGDLKFVDVSGPGGKPDGIINTLDKTIMGSPYPDFYYGMTNRLSYKNFSLSVSLQGSEGSQTLNRVRIGLMSTRARNKQSALSNNYWKSEQDPGDGKTPRPNDAPTGNVRGEFSQYYLDDASYLRINNISLGYMMPSKITGKMKLNSLRFYVTATNPFLFTNYSGFNPDVSNSSNSLTPGIELNDYPLPKTIVFGLNASF